MLDMKIVGDRAQVLCAGKGRSPPHLEASWAIYLYITDRVDTFQRSKYVINQLVHDDEIQLDTRFYTP